MGVRLIVEALDHAPDDLTYRERYVLVVLAESARDETRVCFPGIEDDETFVRRSRLGRSERYAVIKALIKKGAVQRTQRGQKGVRAAYRIAPMLPSQHPENPDAEASDSVRESRTQNDTQHPENPDAENPDADTQGPSLADSGSEFGSLRVRESRTPSPHSPQSPHTYDARADTEPRSDEPATTKQPKQKTPAPNPDAFTVTDHMRAWAAENAPLADVDHETAQFLDHHAAKGSKFSDWKRAWHTWMRNRQKWDSQATNVRPLRPSHTPWQPPADHSAYEEGLK